jgi:NAD(P)-dependent dehydrogenase (short-subunit alcohol dehydrogenase family)
MNKPLTGKVALVTGGSRGLGAATVRLLAEQGADVAFTYVSSEKQAQAVVDEVHGKGAKAVAFKSDQADMSRAPALIDDVVAYFGGLDILVNNAGGPPPGVRLPRFSFGAPTDADWLAMFEFNLFSAVRAVRAALPPMLERGGGSIVNVSSGNARQPGPMNVDYSAAKAALNNLTKSLSEEFGPQGIRVNTVSPGPVRTAWWTEDGGAADILAAHVGANRDAVLDEVAPEMMNLTTGRLVDPQEVADMVALLVSPRSASTTGADMVVDGGFLKAV